MANPPKLYIPVPAPVVDGTRHITRDWVLLFDQLIARVFASGTGTVSGPGTSVANEIVLFDGTTGALLKRATGTGVVHATAGVYSVSAVLLTSEVSGDLPYANLTPSAAISQLLGRGAAAGAGDWEEITLGTGLTMTGTTLSASGAGVPYTGATTDVDLGLHDLNIGSGHYYNYNSVHLAYMQTALENVFIGGAGNAFLASATNSTGVGSSALSALTTGGNNTAIGRQALFNNTTGHNNTAVGWGTLRANLVAHANTAIGHDVLGRHVTGDYNTAIGEISMTLDTDGVSNVAIGYDTLSANLDGATNTAIGAQALKAVTHGSDNVGIGAGSANVITTGNANIGIGNSSLKTLTTGSGNIGIGNSTADGITTGGNNVIIGGSVTGLAAGLANTVILADGAGNQRIHIDSTGDTGIGVTVPTAVLHLKAGTATASTAPLKLNTGTVLTAPELGAIEYNDNGTTGAFYATVNVGAVATRVQIAPSQVGVIGITIDGGGLAITTGVKGYVLVPRAGTITAATLMSTDAATTTGSIIIDVFKGVFGSYPPTVSICSATLPTLSTQKSSQDVTLTSWTKTFAANDVFGFNVTSSPALTRVTLELSVVYT